MAAKKPRGYHFIDWKTIDPWIKTNPSSTYEEFKTAHPSQSVSNFSFGKRKARLFGAVKSVSSKPAMYMKLWTKAVSKDADVAIRDLVAALNKSGRSHLEVVELANPSMLEVREVTK
jgi:hypothetical protein